MRQSETSIDPKQSKVATEPIMEAQPVNSEKETTAIEPSTEAVEQFNCKSISWDRCWNNKIMRTPFFDEPQTYSVNIRGSKVYSGRNPGSGFLRRACSVETVVEAYHPYMAIGQAVMDYMTDTSAEITELYIYRRVVKTITSKKSKCQI